MLREHQGKMFSSQRVEGKVTDSNIESKLRGPAQAGTKELSKEAAKSKVLYLEVLEWEARPAALKKALLSLIKAGAIQGMHEVWIDIKHGRIADIEGPMLKRIRLTKGDLEITTTTGDTAIAEVVID